MIDPRFEVVPLDSIQLDPHNARKRTDPNRAAMRASLSQFGPARSIVVDGNGVIRAGNGTAEAAQEAGIRDVLVVTPAPGQLVAVRKEFASETEAAAYGVVDNQSAALASWEFETLVETLEAVRSDDSIPIEATGFTNAQVDDLLESLAKDAAGEPEGDGDGGGGELAGRYEVLVKCRGEHEQRQIYDRLMAEGWECQILTL